MSIINLNHSFYSFQNSHIVGSMGLFIEGTSSLHFRYHHHQPCEVEHLSIWGLYTLHPLFLSFFDFFFFSYFFYAKLASDYSLKQRVHWNDEAHYRVKWAKNYVWSTGSMCENCFSHIKFCLKSQWKKYHFTSSCS